MSIVGLALFARVIHGAGLSLTPAGIAVALGLLGGSALGLGAGFLGGWYGEITMRCLDVLLAIPPLLLSPALITALGSGTVNVAIAVGLSTAANFARATRDETLRVCRSGFVEATSSPGRRLLSDPRAPRPVTRPGRAALHRDPRDLRPSSRQPVPRSAHVRGVADFAESHSGAGDPHCAQWAALLEWPGRVVLRAQDR